MFLLPFPGQPTTWHIPTLAAGSPFFIIQRAKEGAVVQTFPGSRACHWASASADSEGASSRQVPRGEEAPALPLIPPLPLSHFPSALPRGTRISSFLFSTPPFHPLPTRSILPGLSYLVYLSLVFNNPPSSESSRFSYWSHAASLASPLLVAAPAVERRRASLVGCCRVFVLGFLDLTPFGSERGLGVLLLGVDLAQQVQKPGVGAGDPHLEPRPQPRAHLLLDALEPQQIHHALALLPGPTLGERTRVDPAQRVTYRCQRPLRPQLPHGLVPPLDGHAGQTAPLSFHS
mmetsp:Transcript_62983/g.142145  ORF Transcript_62983/g.142145 Transcript_62983/m.142145 type:complete len:289 (-) Transcript_62983:1016-1882(-)